MQSQSIDCDEIKVNNANSEQQQQQEQVIDSTDTGVLSTTNKDHKSSSLDKNVFNKDDNKIENVTNGNDAVESTKMVIDVSQSIEQNGNVSSTENVLKNVLTDKKHLTITNNEVTAFITNDSDSSIDTKNDSKANGNIQVKLNTETDDTTISSTNKEDKNIEQSNSITEGGDTTTTTTIECKGKII